MRDSFIIRIKRESGKTRENVLDEIAAATGYSKEQIQVMDSPSAEIELAVVVLPGGRDVAAEMEKFDSLDSVEGVYPNTIISQPENEYEDILIVAR